MPRSSKNLRFKGVRQRIVTRRRNDSESYDSIALEEAGCIPSHISQKFCKKTCTKFSSKAEGENICKCGRQKQEHILPKNEDNVDGKSDEKWDAKTHLIKCPTNACGIIEFSGQNRTSRGKYVRLGDDTDGSTALSFLLNDWDLKPPKLLISVTGGAKNFRLEQKLKSLFNNGLLKVAQTSGAWVITGGTNTGVMKHVGKALQGASQYDTGRFRFSHGRNRVHCIGIATWGIVDHRKSLVNSEDVVRYQITSSMDSKGACLDNNHTHFLLVDDGTVNSYGKEITFRSKLEKEIMLSNNGVPAVLLVLEGGPNTVLTVHEAITNEPPMPVVIIKDSGRAADLIAFAYDLLHGEGLLLDFGDAVEHTQLMVKIKQVNPELSDDRCREMYANIVSVVKNRDFVTIFRMEEGSADLDHAILNALLKSQSASKMEQLKLAMTWNRVDIARTQIFTDEATWNTNHLDEAMMTALRTNRVDFIDLLIESGADLHNVVTPDRLKDLYNARKNTGFSMMKHLFDVKREITLDHVDKVLVRLLGDSMENRYKDMEKTHREWRGYRKNWCLTPSHELFIWSVICNMNDMALCFWRTGDEALAKALVGCKMFQSMVNIGDQKNVQEDLILSIEKNMRELQNLAIQLLDECCRYDEPMAAKLLTYRLTSWGNNTCLSWAVAAGFEEFVAHSSCQALLTDMWDGAMSIKTHQSLKTFMGILCPPLILTFQFASKRERDSMPTTEDPQQEAVKETEEKCIEDKAEEKENGSMPRNDSGDLVAKVAIEEEESIKYRKGGRRAFLTRDASGRRSTSYDLSPQLPWYEKILEFYKAPITKFWSNVLAYLAFLLLFAYVVLVKMPSRPSIPEWVLIVFVISLTTEELRQLLQSEAESISKKIYEWGSSKWNIMDAIAIVLFFVGLALRFVDETRSIGHLLYSMDMMLWVIRLLDIFSVNKHLGPYVVMIGRMTVDMLYFLFIMAVFLVAYGVARQAILEPKAGPSWNLLGEVFFAPYFQVYGELFIERESKAGSTIYGTPRMNGYAETLVTLIMAFYLLVANILLLNLLIAVFNHTYDEVQANSTQIWKFQRYHLIMEYSTRPFLVPPMIMINHFILLLQWLYKVCRGVKEKKQMRRLKFHPKKSQLCRILLFEEECITSYLRAKTSLELVGHEEKLRVMNERVNKIGATVADLRREGFSREKDIKAAVKGINRDFEALTRAIKRMAPPNSPLPDIQEVMGSTKSLGAIPNSQLNQKTRYSLGNDRFRSHPQNIPSPLASPITDCATAPVMHAVRTFRRSSTGDHLHSQVGKAISDEGLERKKKYRVQQLRNAQTVDLEDVPVAAEFVNAKDRPRCASFPNQSALRERKTSTLVHESDLLLERIELQEPASPFSQKHRLHVKSRQSPYPATNLKRAVVSDSSVPWEVPDFDYAPESFTDISLVAKDGVDPWTLERGTLNFNSIDGFIDRRSSMGTYEVIDGIPRNPMGRTGIRGRGRLPRWGPNNVHCYIITRWKLDPEDEINQGPSKSQEFYAVNTTKGYGIPSSRVGDRFFLQSTIADVKDKNEVNALLDRGKEIFKGYLDDRRNTDNAWMEITVLHCHDENGIVTSHFKTDNTGQPGGFSWQEMSTDTWLYEPDVAYLRIVAEMTQVPLDGADAARLTWL